jgi:hypothetical protein
MNVDKNYAIDALLNELEDSRFEHMSSNFVTPVREYRDAFAGYLSETGVGFISDYDFALYVKDMQENDEPSEFAEALFMKASYEIRLFSEWLNTNKPSEVKRAVKLFKSSKAPALNHELKSEIFKCSERILVAQMLKKFLSCDIAMHHEVFTESEHELLDKRFEDVVGYLICDNNSAELENFYRCLFEDNLTYYQILTTSKLESLKEQLSDCVNVF